MGYGLAGCPGVGDGEGRRWPGVQQVLKVTVLLQWNDMFFGEVGYRDTHSLENLQVGAPNRTTCDSPQ